MAETRSHPGVKDRPIVRLDGEGNASRRDDHVVIEEPLEIRVNGRAAAVTMRTPGHDEDLAAGFCITEGIVERGEQIERVSPCAGAEVGNVVEVVLAGGGDRAAVDDAARPVFISSSCGLCGKETIERVMQQVEPIACAPFTIDPASLGAMMAAMRDSQAAFDQTGAIHAAAVFTPDGELLVLREDVGRHNAVDKAIGRLALSGRLPIGPAVMVVSGRAGFEIVQKAAMAGIAVVAAVGAPSSLAVDLATEAGMTLIGFVRDDRCNVYAGSERVTAG